MNTDRLIALAFVVWAAFSLLAIFFGRDWVLAANTIIAIVVLLFVAYFLWNNDLD